MVRHRSVTTPLTAARLPRRRALGEANTWGEANMGEANMGEANMGRSKHGRSKHGRRKHGAKRTLGEANIGRSKHGAKQTWAKRNMGEANMGEDTGDASPSLPSLPSLPDVCQAVCRAFDPPPDRLALVDLSSTPCSRRECRVEHTTIGSRGMADGMADGDGATK